MTASSLIGELKPLEYALEHWVPPTGDGYPMSVSVLLTWHRHGLKTRHGRRVHLKLVRIGRNWFTTRESVEEFFQAMWEGTSDPQPADGAAVATAVA